MAVAIYISGTNMSGESWGPPTSNPPSATNDATQQYVWAEGWVNLTGNYGTVSSHGDVMDFTSVGPQFSLGSLPPQQVFFFEQPGAGSVATGYEFVYCPGPTLARPTQQGGLLQILATGSGPGQGAQEISQGSAYSGFTPSLGGANIKFVAKFLKNV